MLWERVFNLSVRLVQLVKNQLHYKIHLELDIHHLVQQSSKLLEYQLLLHLMGIDLQHGPFLKLDHLTLPFHPYLVR